MEPDAPRSKAKVLLLVVVLLAGVGGAFYVGRAESNADRVAEMIRTNKFIGKTAEEMRTVLPEVVFEGGTVDSHTVCKVPGLFGDTYFEVTFKEGKVIGARVMSGGGKKPGALD